MTYLHLSFCSGGYLVPGYIIPSNNTHFVGLSLSLSALGTKFVFCFAPAAQEFRFVCGPHIKITLIQILPGGGTDKY